MRNAVLNAVSNAMRKKGAKFQELWKTQPRQANMEVVEAHLDIIEEVEAKDGKSWVDIIYQANGLKKPIGKEGDNG